MKFSEAFRIERKKAGVTMGVVARHIGTTVTYISRVENDQTGPMTRERILDVAVCFGTSPNALLTAAAEHKGAFDMPFFTKSARGRAFALGMQRMDPDLDDTEFLQRVTQMIEKEATCQES